MDTYFAERRKYFCDSHGSYPLILKRIRGLTIIAETDHDGAPTIEIYKNSNLKKWCNRAKRLWRNTPKEERDEWSIFDAIGEAE